MSVTTAVTVLTVNPQAIDQRLIAQAAACLRDDGVVAFPTETVYGLGARADHPAAVARLVAVKGRPPEKPFAVLVADVDAAHTLADLSSPSAQRLIQCFWPGPLTLIAPSRAGGLPAHGTLPRRAGTIGLRCPAHPIAQALVRAAGVPIAATSANRSGGAEPRTAAEVRAALGSAIDLVLDGGPTREGQPSTVVDLTGVSWRVVRAGALSVDAITAALA